MPGTSFADGQFNNQTSILPPKIFLLLLCLFSWPYILKTIVQTERRCEAYTSFLQKMTWWHVQDNENIENFQYYHSSVQTVFSIWVHSDVSHAEETKVYWDQTGHQTLVSKCYIEILSFLLQDLSWQDFFKIGHRTKTEYCFSWYQNINHVLLLT